MSTKKVAAKYRKIHVPMKHSSVKTLDVMGVHQDGKQCVVGRMVIQSPSDIVVYLLVQDMDKLSRKALHRAAMKRAKRGHESPSVKLLRYGVGT